MAASSSFSESTNFLSAPTSSASSSPTIASPPRSNISAAVNAADFFSRASSKTAAISSCSTNPPTTSTSQPCASSKKRCSPSKVSSSSSAMIAISSIASAPVSSLSKAMDEWSTAKVTTITTSKKSSALFNQSPRRAKKILQHLPLQKQQPPHARAN